MVHCCDVAFFKQHFFEVWEALGLDYDARHWEVELLRQVLLWFLGNAADQKWCCKTAPRMDNLRRSRVCSSYP